MLVLLQGKICTWEWIRELPLNLSHFLWDDLKEGILGPLRWDSGALLINISVNWFIKKKHTFYIPCLKWSYTYQFVDSFNYSSNWCYQFFPINICTMTPTAERNYIPVSNAKKKKTQGRWVVHRVSKQTKNQSNHIDKLEQMEKSNLQLSVDCIGFVLLHSLFGPEYLRHLLK